jgi:hypothetical protein
MGDGVAVGHRVAVSGAEIEALGGGPSFSASNPAPVRSWDWRALINTEINDEIAPGVRFGAE